MSKSILRLVTASALLTLGFLVTGALAGADEKEAAADVEAEIKTALEKLPEADRTAALAQRRCAIEQGNRLGSMGTPIKVMLDGNPVFLCCGGCKKKAAADAKGTIKAAETLRKVNAALGKLSPADRNLAEAQRFCAVMEDSRLGSMGTPVKVLIDGKPVFLCCKACEEEAQANPKDTVAKVAQLKKSHTSN